MISFPILKTSTAEPLAQCAKNPDRCVKCPLFISKTCAGCTANGGTPRCQQSDCYKDCANCGGYKVSTPAICVKSPLAPIMVPKVEQVQWNRIPPGRVLHAKNRAVLVMAGGKRPMFRTAIDSKRYENIEVVGTSLWRVWSSKRGWFSDDLKDYLGVPKHVKLFVTTLVYDDALERATDQNAIASLRDRHDIDAFDPLGYSIYFDESIMNQWFSWRRTLRGLEDTGGDYIDGMPLPFSNTDDMKRLVEKIPQVLFHFSSVSMKEAFFKTACRRVAFLHKFLPRHVSFWFSGPSNEALIRILKKLSPGREKWFLCSAPWMAAHKGYEFRHGKMVRSSLPQDELTARAFENFKALVDSVSEQ
jgi:hypothetical protein